MYMCQPWVSNLQHSTYISNIQGQKKKAGINVKKRNMCFFYLSYGKITQGEKIYVYVAKFKICL